MGPVEEGDKADQSDRDSDGDRGAFEADADEHQQRHHENRPPDPRSASEPTTVPRVLTQGAILSRCRDRPVCYVTSPRGQVAVEEGFEVVGKPESSVHALAAAVAQATPELGIAE